jgi:hypothetical protein
MNCCQCQGIEDLFNEKTVTKELTHYRKKGPDKTTRMIAEALKAEGVQGLSLLDIGGGVGAIQHDLLLAGLQQATDVDASQAYLTAARKEAQRRGLVDQITFKHGNFVDLAEQIPPADLVTLDRVICCYPDMVNLVNLSAARARKLYGLVYPRDTWWMKVGAAVLNFFFRLRKSPFRTFVHPTQAVDALVSRYGLKRHFYRRTLIWQVVVYTR